jgi:hypothetical protein
MMIEDFVKKSVATTQGASHEYPSSRHHGGFVDAIGYANSVTHFVLFTVDVLKPAFAI